MKIFTSFFTIAKNKFSNCYFLLIALILLSGTTESLFAQSNHTVAFTGNSSDFNTAEKFSAAANNTDYYITFDATYMYFGAFRTSGTFGSGDNFSIYLDTDPRNTLTNGNGTTAGRAFNGFTPTLPFNADYTSITEQSYTDPLNRYNGSWASTGVTPTVFTSSTCREVRIALSDLGNPASVYATVWMGYAGGIFSNAPGTSNEGTAATRTMTGFFGSFPVYKSGVTPVSHRAQNTSSANGGGTAISNLSFTTATHTGDYGDITFASGATATVGVGGVSFSGTLSWNAGSTGTNLVVPSGATLFVGGRGIGGTAGQITVNTSNTVNSFSASSAGTISFLGGGVINGANANKSLRGTLTVTVGGPVDFNTASATSLGATAFLQINPGGSVTSAPTYLSGSTLVYNTGTTYTASNEWLPNITSGAGYPSKVTIQGNTSLNFGAASTFRQASGLLTIGSGSSLTLSSVAGGDLRIIAGLTNNNTATGVGFNTNGRALLVPGSCTYTKNGTDNIDILSMSSSSVLSLTSGTNLNLTGLGTGAASCLQTANAGCGITMLGTNTVTIASGATVSCSGTTTILGSNATTSILSFLGSATIASSQIMTAGTTVGTQLNGALSITTAGRFVVGDLQINQGGSVSATNVIAYTASGNLRYNHSSGTYGVFNEWPSSGPTNVFVNANGSSTGISFANNNTTARSLSGTLTINQDVDLSGSGPAALTTLNTIANATATVKGSGNYTQTTAGTFTTANTAGVNGTLITSGTKTFAANNNFTFNNATTSQVTGALLPGTINNLVINNPTAATGTTISNNTLVVSGTTTLTAGALVLPTGAGNLVTMTGNISTPTGGGTLTGSATSNIATSGTTAGTANTLTFTSGATSLNNWTHGSNTFGSSSSTGLASVVTINGTFSLLTTGVPDFYTTSIGGLIIANGATYTDNGANNDRILGAGSFNLQTGATLITGNTSGINATSTASGAIQASGTRTFSGGANYTFNNAAAAQGIGDALDGAGGTGKTGAVTGNIVINNNFSPGVTLNAGTTITVNTPGTFTLGTGTSSGILTAPPTSIINGTGAFVMSGNGATSGSTLITQNASGVSGTVQTTGSNSLTNGANNNTNFSFTGTALGQTTGALLPSIINNLTINNATVGTATATPAVLLSSSTTVNGTLTFTAGHFSINGQTLTANGVITVTAANRLVGTATSNFIVGGSGTIGVSGVFGTSGGGSLNNFTINRGGGQIVVAGTPVTVSGTFSLSNGALAMGANTLTLNGAISFGSGTLITSSTPLVIGGSGAISGNMTATSGSLSFSGITMNRSGSTLTLGSNTTVSNTTGLTLTAGNIALGSFNLTSTSATGQLGAGSTSSMVVATGSGQAFITVPTTGFIAQTLPVGDGTNYTPVILTFTVNGTSGTVGVKTTASAHPSISSGSTPTVYISRYWTFTNTIAATYSYSGTFRYISPDDVVTGTETDLKLSKWNGSIWTEFSGSSVSSPVLSSGSLTQATAPLTATNDYTGRANSAAIDYIWNGTTNDWNTGTNWSPNGIPSAVDNVTIDGSLSGVLCSINSGTFTVNNFTLNGTGTFAMASGTTLSVGGAMTFGGSATATLDCASTFNYAGLASQTVAALNYGNLNLTGAARILASSGTIGICGTFTPGAGGFTIAGSTVDFNGTGAQTIPVFNYNNLTSSSTGARTLASGIVGVDDIFTPGSNSYTITGNTINFSNAGAQTIPAFNYTNITNTGGGARTLASSGTIGIAASFSPGAGAYTVTGSTIDYNGTSGFTMSTFTYNNLIISGNKGAGTVNFGTGTITIGGSFTYTATNSTQAAGSGTVVFNGAGAQTIPALFYSALTISGSRGANNVTLANSGTISIAGTFTPSATFTAGNGYVNTGSTVAFSATNTIPLLTLPTGQTNHFNHLTISGGTATAAGSLVIDGNLTLSGGTFNVTSAANAYATTVNGNLNLGSGVIDWAPTGTTVTSGVINIKGNLNHTGGTGATKQTVQTINCGGFVFNGSATNVSPQTITLATRLDRTTYTVNSGTYVSLLSNMILWGNTAPQQGKMIVIGSLDVGSFVISSGGATALFNLNSGGTLITANTSGITASITASNLTQTFDSAANYEFDGTAAQTANFPGAVTTMNNLTINNSLANVKLNQSETINGNLTFTSGNLDLNGSFNITLGASATIVSESNSSRLINTGSPTATNGYIGTTRTLGVDPGNVANIGLNISTATAMNSTVIKRFPKVVSSIPTALNSISRVYSIVPTTTSAASTISLSYFDGELNSNTETAPSLVTFNSNGANETVAANYSYVGATATNATANTVTYNAANLAAANPFWTCLNSVKYITTANGDWHTGATWIGGVFPPANADVIVNHIVTLSADSAIINSLTISATKSVTVASDKDLTVTDAIINNGTLTIENNGNLLQTNNVANTGSGSTIVKRNSSLLKRLDYTLWSSPVTGQEVYDFSKFTLPNRFYVYNTAADNYNNAMVGLNLSGLQYPSPSLVAPNGVNGTDDANVQFENGKGYLIRVPYNHPTDPAVYPGVFTGVANNGDIPANVSTALNGYNAVGNPYPSRLNVHNFIDGNANITGPLYFWRKTNNADPLSNAYATLTKIAYTANGSPGGDTGTGFFPTGGSQEQNWVINVGQGFIVKATSGSTISFTNSMRRSLNDNQFFKNNQTVNTVTNGLYWLNLNTGIGSYSQMAVGYSSEATLAFDRGIDGENINREFYLTSLIGTGEYSIQGRPDFDSSDVVPLSYKIGASGNYSISIDHKDGLFTDASQPIYVKDNVTATYHDLNTGAYSFASEAGTFNDRFEIVYALPLGVENPVLTANNVIIYSQNNEFVVKSGNIDMSSIKVFDIRGRLLEERKGINATQTTIGSGLANEVLLVQITSVDGITITKKVIR